MLDTITGVQQQLPSAPPTARRAKRVPATARKHKRPIEWDLASSLRENWDYGLDILQRTVLFWDILRERASNMLEHERAGLPTLLNFKYETILDARRFERPANYALLRITELCEDRCYDYIDS